MLRSAGIISHAIAKSWELSKWIQQRSIVVRADEEGAGRRAKREGTVSIDDASVRQLLHRYPATRSMTLEAAQFRSMSAVTPIADKRRRGWIVRFW